MWHGYHVLDVHTHIGRIYIEYPKFTPRKLLKRMDELGIDEAVILPIENPEETHYYSTTEYVLQAIRRYRDRLIPFCNVDPRRGNPNQFDPYPIIEEYISRGCKGLGEVIVGLPVDDSRLQRIYEVVGDLGIPIIMHFDKYRNVDEVGFPRFERMVKKFPKTIFVGHGPHWWAEISAGVTEEEAYGYPKGLVKAPGKVEYFLQKYPNVYADLSANSGWNALARDPEHAKGFLERNRNKLLFGTDLLWEGQEVKILDFLESVEVSSKTLEKILFKNANHLLKL